MKRIYRKRIAEQLRSKGKNLKSYAKGAQRRAVRIQRAWSKK